MSFYKAIIDADIVSVFKPLIDAGKYVIPAADGKIHNKAELDGHDIAGAYGIWVFVNTDGNKRNHCDWRHDTSNLLGYVPKHCLNCWKLVVRPRTLSELFKLLKLMEGMVADDPKCFCKCGVESREYVNSNYGGYFYQRSKEALQARYTQVRKLVDEQISPDVDVIPKRGCTEFELKYGPSDKYEELDQYTSGYADHWEKMIEKNCVMRQIKAHQPELVKLPVMKGWIEFAWGRGDPTVWQFLDGTPLYPPVVKYYPENKEDHQG